MLSSTFQGVFCLFILFRQFIVQIFGFTNIAIYEYLNNL